VKAEDTTVIKKDYPDDDSKTLINKKEPSSEKKESNHQEGPRGLTRRSQPRTKNIETEGIKMEGLAAAGPSVFCCVQRDAARQSPR
jgi:hypothetical protein